VRGAHAWAYMRHDPGYLGDWELHGAAPRFEAGDLPLRMQTEADLLAAARWALLAWEDPGAAVWRSPFWSGIPMLIGEPDPAPVDPAPLLGLLADAGARVDADSHQRSRRFSINVATDSRKVATQSRQGSHPGAKRRDHDIIGRSPFGIPVSAIPPPKGCGQGVEAWCARARDPSRVGAARAHHAVARPLVSHGHPGAERRRRRAPRGAP